MSSWYQPRGTLTFAVFPQSLSTPHFHSMTGHLLLSFPGALYVRSCLYLCLAMFQSAMSPERGVYGG